MVVGLATRMRLCIEPNCTVLLARPVWNWWRFLAPNAVALLGLLILPSRNGNLAMGLFGAMAPVGAAGASLFSAFLVQLAEWKWVFFFPTILAFVVFSLALIPLPWGPSSRLQAYLEWVGSCLGVVGLILLNFAFK